MELFLQSGMPLPDNKGVALPYMMVNWDYPKLKEQFSLLQKYGYDLNDNQELLTDPKAQKIKQTFDYRDRLETVTYLNATDPTLALLLDFIRR